MGKSAKTLKLAKRLVKNQHIISKTSVEKTANVSARTAKTLSKKLAKRLVKKSANNCHNNGGKIGKKRWINRHLSTLSTLSVSTLSLATSSLSTLSLSALSLSTLSLSVVSTLSLSTLSTLPAHRVHGIWKVGTLQVRQPYQAFNCCKL